MFIGTTETTILLVEQNAGMALKIIHCGYVPAKDRIVPEGPAEDMTRDQRVKGAYPGHRAG
jgi:branched-chain amino acid transport system ATP-binding protein